MPGISSKQGTIAAGIQVSKGTPIAQPTVKWYTSGSPSIGPVKERARFTMTDNSRAPADAYTSQLRVEGDVPVYAHPDAMSFIWFALLGASSPVGGPPDYTHTATPSSDTPWLTIWRMVGGVLVEKYTDCKLTSVSMEGSAGSPLTMTMSFIGISSDYLAAVDTVLAPLSSAPLLFMDGGGLVNIGGAPRTLHRLTFTYNNNFSAYQADGYGLADIDPGGIDIDFSFACRFTGPSAFPDYKTFFYGAGTTLVSTTGTQAVDFTYRRAANMEFKVELPKVSYQPFQVQADPGGDPLEVEVGCFVERPASPTPVVTITTKDQKATPGA